MAKRIRRQQVRTIKQICPRATEVYNLRTTVPLSGYHYRCLLSVKCTVKETNE